MRRRSAKAEPFIQPVRTGPMERTGGLDPRALRVPRSRFGRFQKHLADAAATVRLVDYECRYPAPRAAVVRHWHHEVRRGAEERAVIVGDEHIGSRIREHAFQYGA